MTPIPCQFCGAAPSIKFISVYYKTPRRVGPHDMLRVICTCGAIGKCSVDQEAAISSWNEPWQALVSTFPETKQGEALGVIATASARAISMFEDRVRQRKNRLTWWAVNVLQDDMAAIAAIAKKWAGK